MKPLSLPLAVCAARRTVRSPPLFLAFCSCSLGQPGGSPPGALWLLGTRNGPSRAKSRCWRRPCAVWSCSPGGQQGGSPALWVLLGPAPSLPAPPAPAPPSLHPSGCATSQGQLQQCLRGAVILGKYLVILNCSAGGSPPLRWFLFLLLPLAARCAAAATGPVSLGTKGEGEPSLPRGSHIPIRGLFLSFPHPSLLTTEMRKLPCLCSQSQ